MKFGIRIRVLQNKNDTSSSKKEEQYDFFEKRNIRVRILHMTKYTSTGSNIGFDASMNICSSPNRDYGLSKIRFFYFF